MDGADLELDCGSSNSVLCDNCQITNRKHRDEPEGDVIQKRRMILYDGPRAREIHELTQKEQLDLRRLKGLMESLKERCSFCWAIEGNSGGHRMVHCTEMKERRDILGMGLLEVTYIYYCR